MAEAWGTRNQIANICWIIKKAREFQKALTSASLRKSLWLCGSQQTVENSLWDGNIRPPYLPPEKSVWRSRSNSRTGHETTDWFQIGKGVHQGWILSPCLFNFYAEYIMWNASLDETQAGIKISGRNINNFRYADEWRRKWKKCYRKWRRSKRASWWMWKKRVKSWLKTQHSKKKQRSWHSVTSLHDK